MITPLPAKPLQATSPEDYIIELPLPPPDMGLPAIPPQDTLGEIAIQVGIIATIAVAIGGAAAQNMHFKLPGWAGAIPIANVLSSVLAFLLSFGASGFGVVQPEQWVYVGVASAVVAFGGGQFGQQITAWGQKRAQQKASSDTPPGGPPPRQN